MNYDDTYDKKVENYINEIQLLRHIGLRFCKKVVSETLFFEDIYFMSLLDKCLRVIDGYIEMLKQRNLTCAGILLRVQLDNCMRTYAMYIAEDKHQVMQSLLSSEVEINKLKDKSGNRLTDAYLREQLNCYDSQFSDVYKQSSGYIHHSEKALYSIAKVKEYKGKIIELNIGNPLSDEYNSVIFECTEAFIYFVEFQFRLTEPVVASKKRYEEDAY